VLPPSGYKVDLKPLTANMIYRIIKGLFESAAEWAKLKEKHTIVQKLIEASTHWLRHTSLTHQLQSGIDLVTVRGNARYPFITTTSRYLWEEVALRHRKTNENFTFKTKNI